MVLPAIDASQWGHCRAARTHLKEIRLLLHQRSIVLLLCFLIQATVLPAYIVPSALTGLIPSARYNPPWRTCTRPSTQGLHKACRAFGLRQHCVRSVVHSYEQTLQNTAVFESQRWLPRVELERISCAHGQVCSMYFQRGLCRASAEPAESNL